MKIVLLGKLRSGKTTVSSFIKEFVKEDLNIELQSKPLAAPIYKEAKDFYERHGLIWRKNRTLLEGIGGALNDDYPNGDKIVELYDKDFDLDEHIIVEDCRRITQADYFRDKGAYLIKVVASATVRKSRCKSGEWSEGHITDTELDDYPVDFEIVNDGNDLAVLKIKIYETVMMPIMEQELKAIGVI